MLMIFKPSSTTQYKQRGKGLNEKGTQPPMDSQKKQSTQTQSPSNNVAVEKSFKE
jgi:hypothetical protein